MFFLQVQGFERKNVFSILNCAKINVPQTHKIEHETKNQFKSITRNKFNCHTKKRNQTQTETTKIFPGN